MAKLESLSVVPLQTRIFKISESLLDFVIEQVPKAHLQEEMIIAITSKIFSLAENCVVEKSKISKAKLIEQEADVYLGEIGYGTFLTIKHGLFVPSAGIDESNSEKDQFIVYPSDPFRSARVLWEGLRKAWKLERLGILMTDSHTTPLRQGVTGISVAHWGFKGLENRVGTPDLFGREMKMTAINIADALATAATVMMGETNECQPMAIVKCKGIEFAESIDPNELRMPMESDLYFPLFQSRVRK